MLAAINPVALPALRIAATFFPVDQFARRALLSASWVVASRASERSVADRGQRRVRSSTRCTSSASTSTRCLLFGDWDVRDPFFLKNPFLTMSDLYLVFRKTALVAIDLQNAIMEISAAPYPATQVVQRNRKIADELRARGGFGGGRRSKLKEVLP